MSKVPVTINCIVYPKNKTVAPYPATLVGEAWLSDKQVGGGPMPGGPGEPDRPPLLLWGAGGPGFPTNPIAGWDPGTGTFPDLPEMPANPEQPKPPPPDGGWGWSPQYGWGYFPPGGGGKPQPQK